MAKTFGEAERNVLGYFIKGTRFSFKGLSYAVLESGKPTCSKGEPKTDIYIAATCDSGKVEEFKISFKKQNADFLENKTTAERAEQLFGPEWGNIISNATYDLKEDFFSRMLIYKEKLSKTERGAITLGWKFELLNVKSGLLSGNMNLSREQVIDVYAGTNLTGDKRDAMVNGHTISNSGIANYILFEETPIRSAQDAIDALNSVEDYVDLHPEVYFACKALNYRSFHRKYDGNRPLAVYVDWSINKDNKLDCSLCFDSPLQQGGDYAYGNLQRAMAYLNALTTDDLNEANVADPGKIHE